jgi:hypothetical protein
MKYSVASALLLILFGLTGCSKNLTESSAERIVQEYADAHTTDQQRRLGHVVIDSCNHLLLEAETNATATCKIHVELTDAGKATFHGGPTASSVQAQFGKQPDGTWIATRVGE